jgi:hypothetical protein
VRISETARPCSEVEKIRPTLHQTQVVSTCGHNATAALLALCTTPVSVISHLVCGSSTQIQLGEPSSAAPFQLLRPTLKSANVGRIF